MLYSIIGLGRFCKICWIVFILSLSISNPTNAQQLKLSSAEKKWVLKNLFVANKAKEITQKVLIEVNKTMQENVLDTIINGGKIDAFRHGYWMALLTQKIGKKKALSLGVAHEAGNYTQFKKGQFEDKALPDSISGVMDLKNNITGAELGLEYPNLNDKELKSVVITKIKQGDFVILKKNAAGKFVNCENEIVIPEKKWNLNYCLVKSNE